MIDWLITFIVAMAWAFVTAAIASRQPKPMRRWVWIAFVEYSACAVYQYMNGADANGYREIGTYLAKVLDASFGWASREALALLLQRPSALDDLVVGAGTNSGSMCAISGFVLFFVRRSPYAAQALVAGLAMFGAFGIYSAFRDACPRLPPQRLFVATVLFPSIAFWTSALHKESFCLMGIGLLLAGWRALFKLRIRAIPYITLGVVLVLMFRAPALPPILLGLVFHFVIERIQRARGAEATIVAPLYLGVGLAFLVLGMLLVTRIAPGLALDRLGESVARQQGLWARSDVGGSGFDVDAPVQQSMAQQLAAAPFGLLNALFRPQLFDVTSASVLVGALEMTAITFLLVRAAWQQGPRKLVARIQASPVLLMCTVVTLVGCAFVGLTTRNFGSMARYRVPFLPFYGVLLAIITEKVKLPAAKAKKPVIRRPKPIGSRATAR